MAYQSASAEAETVGHLTRVTRKWIRQTEIETGQRESLATEERAALTRFRRRVGA